MRYLRFSAPVSLAVLIPLQLLGVLLFFSGFFLTRFELDHHSRCGEIAPPLALVDVPPEQRAAPPRFCDETQPRTRVIAVLIDALRFDFALQDQRVAELAEGPAFANKLPVITDTLHAVPERARLFRFLADPPTTTAQRLKALTTGAMPTFIDLSKNFFSDEVLEDNLISQAHAAGRRVVFFGDDTWLNLYPRAFSHHAAFPSFNVKDLHTVDYGVQQNLIPLLSREDGDAEWDLLICHFLGVDHVGHRYGSHHSEMASKLAQMNVLIQDVMHRMPHDAVLLVFGDHGMTWDGNHGGNTRDEISTPLFVYAGSDVPVDAFDDVVSDLQLEYDPADTVLRPPDIATHTVDPAVTAAAAEAVPRHRSVAQIDFVPLVCGLLGVPVPFSSLGSVIPELTLRGTRLSSVRANAWQIQLFLEAYADASPSFRASPQFAQLSTRFATLEREYAAAVAAAKDAAHATRGYLDFIQAVGDACREMWTKFDLPAMAAGIVLMAVASLWTLWTACRDWIPCHSLAGWLSYLRLALRAVPGDLVSWARREWLDIAGLVALGAHALVMLSNSFIVAEAAVLHFLCQSLLLLLAVHVFARVRDPSIPAIAVVSAVALRTAFAFAVARDSGVEGAEAGSTHVVSGVASVTVGQGVLLFSGLSVQPSIAHAAPERLYMLAMATTTIVSASWCFPDIPIVVQQCVYAASVLATIDVYRGTNKQADRLCARLPYLASSSLLPVVALVSGARRSAALGPLLLVCMCVARLLRLLPGPPSRVSLHRFLGLLAYLLVAFAFFASGHTTQISNIDFAAGFVGVSSYNFLLNGILVVLAEFGAMLVVLAAALAWLLPDLPVSEPRVPGAAFLLGWSVQLLASAAWAGFHRRHLMVWAIFAPKLLFSAVHLLILLVFLAMQAAALLPWPKPMSLAKQAL